MITSPATDAMLTALRSADPDAFPIIQSAAAALAAGLELLVATGERYVTFLENNSSSFRRAAFLINTHVPDEAAELAGVADELDAGREQAQQNVQTIRDYIEALRIMSVKTSNN